MASHAPQPAAGQSSRIRHCAVLLAPDAPTPTPLLLGLTHRRLAPAVVADAPSLIYQLITGPAEAVIIVEPQHQPRLDELTDVLAASFPALALWQYHATDASGRPRLARLDAAHPPDENRAPTHRPPTHPDPGASDQSSPTATRCDDSGRPLAVTEQELDMLLGTHARAGVHGENESRS